MKRYRSFTHDEAIERLCTDLELWGIIEKLCTYLLRDPPPSSTTPDWTRRLLSAECHICVERAEEGLAVMGALGFIQREKRCQNPTRSTRTYHAELLVVEDPLEKLHQLRSTLGIVIAQEVHEDGAIHGLDMMNVNLRSQGEHNIFEEVLRRNILVYPNQNVFFVNDEGVISKRQPDFVLMIDGRAVILEVMGRLYHTPATAVKDHERGRIFERMGVYRVFFYDSEECKKQPAKVIDEIISLVRRG